MTYGVPYSFVPGTKAKADEVNANFIDILSKIEDTNTRIDETNSQAAENLTEINNKIEEVENSCVNLDLSNLSSKGKSVLNAKADASLLDGTWTNKSITLCTSKSISASTTHTFSLSSYLPNDGAKYELIVTMAMDFSANAASQAAIYVRTDFMSASVPLIRFRSGMKVPTFTAGSSVFVTSTGRTLYVYNTEFGVDSPIYTLKIVGYRKVR